MGDLGVCRAARRPNLWVGGWIPVRRKQQESLHALPSQTAAETAPSHRELTPASGRTTGNEKPMASQSGPVTGYPGAGSSRRVRDTRGAGRGAGAGHSTVAAGPNEPPVRRAAPAPASTSPTVADIPAPATTLDRPVAIRDNRTVVDSQVQPTGLFRNRNSDPVTYSPTSDPIAYSPASGLMPAQPLPVGPSVNLNGIPLPSAASAPTPPPPDVPYTWRQPPTGLSAQGSPPGTIVSTPMDAPIPRTVPGPGLGGAPIGNPVSDGCMAPGAGCADGCCAGLLFVGLLRRRLGRLRQRLLLRQPLVRHGRVSAVVHPRPAVAGHRDGRFGQ